jgi:STE24 endopeptidase
MAQFDPAAATARYLSALTPEQHQRAIDYTQGSHWLLLWGWIVGVIVALAILRSGILVRLRDRLGGASRPVRSVFGVAMVFTVVEAIATLPWTIYSEWWRERQYQLSSQAFGGWFGEWAMQLVIGAVVSSLFFLALYTLIRRAPRRWWAWGALIAGLGIVFIVVLSPVLIEPLFNRYTPAPAGPVRDRVVALAKTVGVPSDKILVYDGSKQSERYTANVSGLFGTARVAMSDTMTKQGADMAEVIGVVGHEMGHYVRGHILWFAGFLIVMAIAGFWLTDRLFPVVLRRTGEADRIRGIGDPAGLPVLTVVLSTLGLLATPLFNSMTRFSEADADHFSLVHAHEPDGLSKALVKTIAYRASSPGRLEEIIFYDHPSVERRVRSAMDWKAANPTLVGTPPTP